MLYDSSVTPDLINTLVGSQVLLLFLNLFLFIYLFIYLFLFIIILKFITF